MSETIEEHVGLTLRAHGDRERVEFELVCSSGCGHFLAALDRQWLRQDPARGQSGRGQLYDDLIEAFKAYSVRTIEATGQTVERWQHFPPASGRPS